MRLPTLLTMVTGSLIASAVGLSALLAVPPSEARKDKALPFACFTRPWDGDFKVVDVAYDKAKYQLTWLLEATKDTRLRPYVAELNDGDGVNINNVPVTFNPNPAKLEAGDQILATVSLRSVPVSDVAKVIIRERR